MIGSTTAFCLLLIIIKADDEIRTWTQSNSLGDLQKWRKGRLPCQGQSIVLPKDVVFVPKTFTFGPDTILPQDGVLLFDGNLFSILAIEKILWTLLMTLRLTRLIFDTYILVRVA